MDIINLARELGAAIQQNEEYIDYKIKEQNVECDEALQKVIEEFNLKKVSINNEIGKENVDQEKIDELNNSIGELYNEIMHNENMKSYNESKQKFEEILGKVSFIINSAAQGQDPYSIDAEVETSCGGNCSGCSGC